MVDNEVKVWNRNSYDYKEKFKGEEIFIKAGGYVKMDRWEANQFLGSYVPIIKGKDEQQDPRSYKYLEIDQEDLRRIRIQQEGGSEGSQKTFVCHACGKEFLTKNGLLKHIKTKHLDEMQDKDARDELIDDEDIEVDEDEA